MELQTTFWEALAEDRLLKRLKPDGISLPLSSRLPSAPPPDDYLADLPVELLHQIFDYLPSLPGLIPICRALLPLQRKRLYRNITLYTYLAPSRLCRTFRLSHHLDELVESLELVLYNPQVSTWLPSSWELVAFFTSLLNLQRLVLNTTCPQITSAGFFLSPIRSLKEDCKACRRSHFRQLALPCPFLQPRRLHVAHRVETFDGKVLTSSIRARISAP